MSNLSGLSKSITQLTKQVPQHLTKEMINWSLTNLWILGDSQHFQIWKKIQIWKNICPKMDFFLLHFQIWIFFFQIWNFLVLGLKSKKADSGEASNPIPTFFKFGKNSKSGNKVKKIHFWKSIFLNLATFPNLEIVFVRYWKPIFCKVSKTCFL